MPIIYSIIVFPIDLITNGKIFQIEAGSMYDFTFFKSYILELL